MPFFSVVIPTYNRRERVLTAIRSVLEQRFSDYELIVVDDGSTDGTVEAVLALGKGVRVLSQPNRGPSGARNAAARVATGDYLAFLDSDDSWFPWTLEHYAGALREHGLPSWLYGIEAEKHHPPSRESETERSDVRYDCYFDAAREGMIPLPTGVVVKRKLFQESGGFLEGLHVGEDVDLWFRIGTAPGFVRVQEPATFVRQLHAGSLGEHPVKSYLGNLQLLRRERAGLYPGGIDASRVRRGLLENKLMYYATRYRRRGNNSFAARFYLEVLALQVAGGFHQAMHGNSPNRFLVSFPVFMVSPRLYALLLGHDSKVGAEDTAT